MSGWNISVKTGVKSTLHFMFCLRLSRKRSKTVLKYQIGNILKYWLFRLSIKNSGEIGDLQEVPFILIPNMGFLFQTVGNKRDRTFLPRDLSILKRSPREGQRSLQRPRDYWRQHQFLASVQDHFGPQMAKWELKGWRTSSLPLTVDKYKPWSFLQLPNGGMVTCLFLQHYPYPPPMAWNIGILSEEPSSQWK